VVVLTVKRGILPLIAEMDGKVARIVTVITMVLTRIQILNTIVVTKERVCNINY